MHLRSKLLRTGRYRLHRNPLCSYDIAYCGAYVPTALLNVGIVTLRLRVIQEASSLSAPWFRHDQKQLASQVQPPPHAQSRYHRER